MKAFVAASFIALVFVSCKSDKPKDGSAPTAKPGAAAPAPTGSGVIEGTVGFTGPVPPPTEWGGRNDAACGSRRPGTIQLVRVEDGKLADAFVYVKAGLSPGSHPAPTTPVVIDQKECEFSPRVVGAMSEQPIRWGNSDPLMHNVNTGQFNQALTSAGASFTKPLEAGGSPMITVRCDVHPWMRAYVGVLDHPYFQVTKADGAYRLSGLPDGEYTVGVWHEVLPALEKVVKVSGGHVAKLDFELSR